MLTPPVFQTDAFGLIGTSLTAGFGVSFGWAWNFMRAVKVKYAARAVTQRPTGIMADRGRPPAIVAPLSARQLTGYAAQSSPSYYMNAVPGRKCGDISGIMATVLAPFIAGRTTVYLVELGTNDVNVTPAATFIPQVTAIRDAIIAAPYFRMLIWVGVWCAGENWPDGANAFDLTVDGIKDKDDQTAAVMAGAPNCYYISWRTLRLNTLNATSNPTHATSGIYTLDQTHPTNTPTATVTSSGGDLLANYTAGLLTFA